jgi:hypothetical protein
MAKTFGFLAEKIVDGSKIDFGNVRWPALSAEVLESIKEIGSESLQEALTDSKTTVRGLAQLYWTAR